MKMPQSIELALYGYDPTEFQPIRYQGELVNKGEFIAYKAGKFAEALGRVAHRTLDVTITAGSVVLDHMVQEC